MCFSDFVRNTCVDQAVARSSAPKISVHVDAFFASTNPSTQQRNTIQKHIGKGSTTLQFSGPPCDARHEEGARNRCTKTLWTIVNTMHASEPATLAAHIPNKTHLRQLSYQSYKNAIDEPEHINDGAGPTSYMILYLESNHLIEKYM